MSFKPFYVHRHWQGKLANRHPRGFTAYVTEDPENPHNAVVQATFCHPKDQFCRRDGRKFAAEAPKKIINKRNLPRMMAALSDVCELPDDNKPTNWQYIYRYAL